MKVIPEIGCVINQISMFLLKVYLYDITIYMYYMVKILEERKCIAPCLGTFIMLILISKYTLLNKSKVKQDNVCMPCLFIGIVMGENVINMCYKSNLVLPVQTTGIVFLRTDNPLTFTVNFLEVNRTALTFFGLIYEIYKLKQL